MHPPVPARVKEGSFKEQDSGAEAPTQAGNIRQPLRPLPWRQQPEEHKALDRGPGYTDIGISRGENGWDEIKSEDV